MKRKPGSGLKKGLKDKKTAQKIRSSILNVSRQSERDLARKFKKSQTFVRHVKKYYNMKTYKRKKAP